MCREARADRAGRWASRRSGRPWPPVPGWAARTANRDVQSETHAPTSPLGPPGKLFSTRRCMTSGTHGASGQPRCPRQPQPPPTSVLRGRCPAGPGPGASTEQEIRDQSMAPHNVAACGEVASTTGVVLESLVESFEGLLSPGLQSGRRRARWRRPSNRRTMASTAGRLPGLTRNPGITPRAQSSNSWAPQSRGRLPSQTVSPRCSRPPDWSPETWYYPRPEASSPTRPRRAQHLLEVVQGARHRPRASSADILDPDPGTLPRPRAPGLNGLQHESPRRCGRSWSGKRHRRTLAVAGGALGQAGHPVRPAPGP